MAMIHRCHTCGARYSCIASWCPGCGKRLGHRRERAADTSVLVEIDHYGDEVAVCDSCGHIFNEVRARFCPHCGGKVVGRRKGERLAAQEEFRAYVDEHGYPLPGTPEYDRYVEGKEW